MDLTNRINRRLFNKTMLSSGAALVASSTVGPRVHAGPGETKPTDMRLREAHCETQRFQYRSPMKFGGRVMNDIVLLDVRVTIESRDGKIGEGTGSMTMGNIWAWPGGQTDPEKTLEAMIAFGKKIVGKAADFKAYGHPLEWTHDYAESYDASAAETVRESGIGEAMPKLAQRVAASPLEAAVFDAYGKMLDRNVYNLLSREFCNRDLAFYLGEEFQGEYLDRYTLRRPKARMPLYHLVGALDPLSPTEVARPLNDGLPEDLAEWIARDQLTHIKIKLNGDDLDWDVRRVLEIDRVACQAQEKRGCKHWIYSADFNERCADVEYVLGFFRRIREKAPAALDRLQYVEQPTHRDLKAFPSNRMHRAAEIKPIVIDESLIDVESLHESRKMGYSGVALKACKGHGEALLMGAAAQKYKMFLCVQDLTCPGASFLQSASLSARIPTVAAIEGNARQYCPDANKPWVSKYPSMFLLKDGTLGTDVLDGPGLY